MTKWSDTKNDVLCVLAKTHVPQSGVRKSWWEFPAAALIWPLQVINM